MHQNQNIPKGAMDSQEPGVTFVTELQLIVNFMDDNDLLDHDEDFEKELAAISLEVSLSLSLFSTELWLPPILDLPRLIITTFTNKHLNSKTQGPYHELLMSKFQNYFAIIFKGICVW